MFIRAAVWIIALTVVGGVVGGVLGSRRQQEWQTSSTFYLAVVPGAIDVANSGNLVEARARSYVRLLQADGYSKKAAQNAKIDGEAKLRVLAEFPAGTNLLDVQAVAASADESERAMKALIKMIPRDTAALDDVSRVKVLEVKPMIIETKATRTSDSRKFVGASMLTGFLVGLAVVFAERQKRFSERGAQPRAAVSEA